MSNLLIVRGPVENLVPIGPLSSMRAVSRWWPNLWFYKNVVLTMHKSSWYSANLFILC